MREREEAGKVLIKQTYISSSYSCTAESGLIKIKIYNTNKFWGHWLDMDKRVCV